MLYAHWEGFVQVASEAYVEFVARRRLTHVELNDGFLALALRARLQQFGRVDDVSTQIDFARFLSGDLESRAYIPRLGIIRAGANLTSSRLKSIVLLLGLDYRPFELKENLIDKQLLQWRNSIAHGRKLYPQEDEFELLYREITALLRAFKDQLLNAAIMASYRRVLL